MTKSATKPNLKTSTGASKPRASAKREPFAEPGKPPAKASSAKAGHKKPGRNGETVKSAGAAEGKASGKRAMASASREPKASKAATASPTSDRASGNGRLAGVLQAARSVASKTTKIPESPKLRRSPLSQAELAEFRETLLAKRHELVTDMANLEDEARRGHSESGPASATMPIHMADVGSDTWEQEFTLNLIETERKIVREIDEALERIESKAYGVCLATGRPITKARLRAKPWAKYCIEYARKRELGLV